MPTQLETLRLIAPEFAAVDDTTVQAMLDLAPLITDPMLYPENVRDLAMVYQACILLAQRSASENGTASYAGDVKMEKEGDLTRSFGSGSSSSLLGSKNQYEIMLDRLSLAIGFGGVTRYGYTGEVR